VSQYQQSNLITRAAELARKLHAEQVRKSSGKFYFTAHLVPVSHLVADYGGSEIAIAAALLHDAIEDQGEKCRSMILGLLGSEVLSVVEECTEAGTGGVQKAPWQSRKEAYLAHLSGVSADALIVSIADKLQSAEELAADVENRGDQAYSIFKTGKSGSLWFHRALVNAFYARIEALYMDEMPIMALAQRFESAVNRLV